MVDRDPIRSRVFVSCGQNNDEEKKIAKELESMLIKLGYDPYVAVYNQSTKSVISNILNNLRNCEYYLFVDFKREGLIPESSDSATYLDNKLKEPVHRGSLFSNQELSLAIYLQKPIIAFQENGIKRDGMLNAIQANVIPFDDRDNLVNKVIRKVEADWITNWRNETIFGDINGLDISPEMLDEYNNARLPARFFHVTIKNLHKDISARNCVAYLEAYNCVIKTTPKQTKNIVREPVELKWKGMKSQSVLIPPGTDRKFDALYIYENMPHIAYIGINSFLVDYSGYSMMLEDLGTFELDFSVYSDSFPPIKATYILEFESELKKTRFYKKDL